MEPSKRHYSFFPKTLEQCIEPLTRPVMKAHGLAESRVATQWESIVGEELARHTLPEKLSFPHTSKSAGKKTGGTLVISVENGFATELMHMQPVILERLSSYFGYQAITRLTISHSWTQAPEKPDAPAMKPTLSRTSASLADDVNDPDIKDALQSLAKTLSGQNG